MALIEQVGIISLRVGFIVVALLASSVAGQADDRVEAMVSGMNRATGTSRSTVNSMPELRTAERWVIVASRADMDDAVALAENYRRKFPETFVLMSENGNFAISIGRFNVSQKPSYVTDLIASKQIPSDSYSSTGARLLSVVWPATEQGNSNANGGLLSQLNNAANGLAVASGARQRQGEQVVVEATERQREQAIAEQRRRENEAATEKARRETEELERQAAAERAAHESQTRLAAERERRDEENARREREAAQQRVLAERAKKETEERLDAERARERLHAQAIAERGEQIASKLKEMGYELISPIDLELDWPDLRKSSKKIALRGMYTRIEDVDGLAVSNKDRPLVRLYLETASRDARKAMLECRNGDFSSTLCRMVIGGTVQSCTRNKGKINEAEVPCINITEAFVLPEGWAYGN